MTPLKTAASMGLGFLATLSLGFFSQTGQAQDRPAPAGQGVSVLVLDELATIGFIEKSEVAALREGVIDEMELRLGDPAFKGKPIGYLHRETAELAVTKAKIQADMKGSIEKAHAAFEVAAQVVARNQRLNERKPGMVSAEEVAKAQGELNVAEAQETEAKEAQQVAKAEYDLAYQLLKEHTIVAPFDGVVIQRMKEPGETVRANEAVVTIGKLSRLCADTYVPLKYAFKIKEGQVVEISPRVETSDDDRAMLEQIKVRGKVTFVDPQFQASVAALDRRIRVEFDNPDFVLMPGMKAKLTVFLNNDVATRNPNPTTR